MEIKYVVADDGEKYPIKTDAAPEVPAWITDNFDAVEYKVVSPDENKVVVSEPDMFSGIRNRVINSKMFLGMVSTIKDIVADSPVALAVLGWLFAIVFAILATEKSIVQALIFGAIVASICLTGFSISRLLYRLKNYGLKKGQMMYVIDWHDEKIKAVKVRKVDCPEKCFNDSYFIVEIDNKNVTLSGANIYFSQSEAEQMLLNVQSQNDTEISKYYPEWKSDKRFYQFYQDRVSTYYVGDKYKRDYHVLCDCKELVKAYVADVKETIKAAQKRHDEESSLRDAIEQLNKI